VESNLLIIARIVFAKIVHGMSRYCFNFGFQLLKIAIKIKLAENYNLANYFATTIINASFIFWHFKTFFILEKNCNFIWIRIWIAVTKYYSWNSLLCRTIYWKSNRIFSFVLNTLILQIATITQELRVKRVLFQLLVNFILKSTTTANG
jgi:hypothetical protein